MVKPIIIINFKTYKQATGKKALKLAKICERVSKKTKAKVMVAVSATDIYLVAKKVKIPVLAQHVDYFKQGRNTGKILPEAVKQAGAQGTFINHSENPLPLSAIKKTIDRCKKFKLLTVVCVPSIQIAKKIKKLRPWAIAYEIPELVASGKAITKINPDKVKKFSNLFKNSKIIPLCGAGISLHEDIKLSLQLGSKGALIASAVVKAKNQNKALTNLLKK